MLLKREVLKLYETLIKESRSWRALKSENTEAERKYILNETRMLFRLNKHVTNEETICEHLREGYARLEMAKHYGIPYPRPLNYPTYYLRNKKELKGQKRMDEQSKPVYMKSYFDKENKD